LATDFSMVQIDYKNKTAQIGRLQINSEKAETNIRRAQKEVDLLQASFSKNESVLAEFTRSLKKSLNDVESSKNTNAALRDEIEKAVQYEGDVRAHISSAELELRQLCVQESELQANNNLFESYKSKLSAHNTQLVSDMELVKKRISELQSRKSGGLSND